MFHGSYHYDLIHAHSAVVCYGTARKERKRKYLKYAQKCHKHIKFIRAQRITHFVHMDYLLDAELEASKKVEWKTPKELRQGHPLTLGR